MTTMNDETAIIPTPPAGGTSPAGDHDGLSEELAAAAPRKWWNRGTVGLGVAAVLMGGFLGGVQAQKTWGAAETGAAGGSPTGGRGTFPGGMSASGAPGGFGQQSTRQQSTQQQSGTAAATAAATSGTTGKVKLVNGKTIYVETADGAVVTVKTDGTTTVNTATKGELSDVKAGQSITVRGETGSDGSVTAESVTATE